MLQYTPGDSVAHRLDPRSKLAFQAGFAVAVFARPTMPWLAGMTIAGLAVLFISGASLRQTLRAYWFVILLLFVGPVIAALTLGPPWVDTGQAARSAMAVARVIPVLFVSAAFIYSTPVRETRAAVQWLVPGRPGRLLGVGMALTFRFLPVVREDVRRIREGLQARASGNRPFHDRVRRIAVLSVVRAMERSERLTVALQARCFAWNPTLPRLSFSRVDYVVLGIALVLALVGVVSALLELGLSV